jgi:hypothetical protein
MHEIRAALVPAVDGGATPIATKKKTRSGDAGLGGSLARIAIQREETRRTNQRREDRDADLVRSATIHSRRRKHEVQVVNVSPWGAMIECDLEPRIGERVDIEFPGCNRTAASVRWIRDGRIGLEFGEETTIIANAAVRKAIYGESLPDRKAPVPETQAQVQAFRAPVARQPRQPLVWTGTLYWSFEAFGVKLHNISPEGAMMECERELEEGAPVRLNLAEAGTIAGVVRWSAGGQVGMCFDERFDLRLLALARNSSSTPVGGHPVLVEEREMKKEAGRIARYWSRLR